MLKSFLQRKNKETSVLNTDRFDRRRFGQIYDMSKGLQDLEKHEEVPLFKELLGDMWASLYKVNPKLKDHSVFNRKLLPNKQLIKQMMKEKSYKKYHKSTQLDDLLSAVGTVNFGKQTSEWIQEQKQKNEELQNLMDRIQELINQMNQENIALNSDRAGQIEDRGSDGQREQTEQELGQAMSDLAQILNDSIDKDSHGFSQAMYTAIEETDKSIDGLESLFGENAGNQKGELQKMPLRDKITLAEMISHNKKMKEIAEWAGKYTSIAQTKQKMLHKDVTEQSGVEIGDDLERLLPSELALYANPSTKKEFLRRYTEKETLQYEQKGKDRLGRGSIILCLDQSQSMKRIENESKGFALALMSIAKRQKRNFAYIPFSSDADKAIIFPRGKINAKEMVEFAKYQRGGGTDFFKPLQESLSVIAKDRFKDSDLIFITDGEDNLSDQFIKVFNKQKEKEKFNVLSLLIGNQTREITVKKFSDRVIKVDNLNDEGSFEVFEI